MSEQLEQNKATVRQYVAAFNRGDLETLRGLFTPDALVYGVLGWGARDSAAQARQIGLPLE